MINTRIFSAFSLLNLNRDLAEWWRLNHCENGNDLSDSFLDKFEKIVGIHAPIQTVKKWTELFDKS